MTPVSWGCSSSPESSQRRTTSEGVAVSQKMYSCLSLLDVDPETPTSTAADSSSRPATPEGGASLMSFLESMSGSTSDCLVSKPQAAPVSPSVAPVELDVQTLQLLIDSLANPSYSKSQSQSQSQMRVSDDLPPGLSAPKIAEPEPVAAVAASGSAAAAAAAAGLKTTDTTMMLRNVPYEAQQVGVLRVLENSPFRGRFTFFYCPLDFRSLNNLGYAFVNLDSPETAADFVAFFDGLKVGTSLLAGNSNSGSAPAWDKPLRVSRARIQGYSANVEHYRNSPVNLKSEEFKPMIFALKPHHHKLPFPAPNSGASSSASDAGARDAAAGTASLRPRERRLHAKAAGGGSHSSGGSGSNNGTNMRVFVGGLGPETDSMSLWEYMTQFGRVMDAQVLIDPVTGKSRNYGFCTFADVSAASRALEKQQHTLDGREIVVRKYTSNK